MSATAKAPCHHQNLVISEHCRVEQCRDRDTIHLTLGNVTIRLDSTSFVRVATALHAAANRVEAQHLDSTTTRLLC